MALHLKSTGIDFTDFSDATESSELLNDYEEGSWTMTNADGNKNPSVQNCFYTKIGRWCHCTGQITSNAGGYAHYQWGGIPFTTSSLAARPAGGTGYNTMFTSDEGQLGCLTNQSQTSFYFLHSNASTVFTASKDFYFYMSYLVD